MKRLVTLLACVVVSLPAQARAQKAQISFLNGSKISGVLFGYETSMPKAHRATRVALENGLEFVGVYPQDRKVDASDILGIKRLGEHRMIIIDVLPQRRVPLELEELVGLILSDVRKKGTPVEELPSLRGRLGRIAVYRLEKAETQYRLFVSGKKASFMLISASLGEREKRLAASLHEISADPQEAKEFDRGIETAKELDKL